MSKSIKSKPTRPKSENTTAHRASTPSSVGSMASNAASKCDQIVDLLRRKQGASLHEIQRLSGWQSHSVRGFLSGTIKKRLGLKLSSAKSDGTRHYFVAKS